MSGDWSTEAWERLNGKRFYEEEIRVIADRLSDLLGPYEEKWVRVDSRTFVIHWYVPWFIWPGWVLTCEDEGKICLLKWRNGPVEWLDIHVVPELIKDHIESIADLMYKELKKNLDK